MRLADGSGGVGLIIIIIISFVLECSISADCDSALALIDIDRDRASIYLLKIAEVQHQLLILLFLGLTLLRAILVLTALLQVLDLKTHGRELQVVRAVAGDGFEVFQGAVELALLSDCKPTFLYSWLRRIRAR